MFVSGASESEFPLSRGCAGRLYRLPSPVDTPERTMGVSSYPTFPALALFCYVEKKRSAGNWAEERSPRRERNVVIEFPFSVSANIK